MALTPVIVQAIAGKSGGTTEAMATANPLMQPYTTLWDFTLKRSKTNWSGVAVNWNDIVDFDEKGPKGDTGIDNYTLAVLNGFAGTYEEWALDQVGEDGQSITGQLITGDFPAEIPVGVIVMKKKA